MGNRACVVFTDGRNFSPAIYLHWNGGPESVYAFLDALKRYGALGDCDCAAACLTQLVGNYLGGTLSLALFNFEEPPARLDPGDNGLYLVTLRGDGYSVRRWVDGVERDQEFAARERAEAMSHRYSASHPTIAEQIDQLNQVHFARSPVAQRRAANDAVGG